jgi:hypothetical protein
MFNSTKRKVFCIGFNKTGTSSLHDYFLECRLTSCHNDRWPNYSKVDNGNKYFTSQCYSDGEQSDFIQLANWFPKSLFILNIRPDRDWLNSRIKHVMRYNKDIDIQGLLTHPDYKKMARDFFFDEEEAIKKWVSERRIYTKQVESYFADKQNFIRLDITKTENWENIILDFFDKNQFSYQTPIQKDKIHSNSRSNKDLNDQVLLNKYLAIVDNVLKA